MSTEQSISEKLARIKRPPGMPDDEWAKFMERKRSWLMHQPKKKYTESEVNENLQMIMDDWDRRFGKPEGEQ